MRLKIPREKSFFALFDRAAANLVQGARLLAKMMSDYSDPDGSRRAIIEAEHQGDEITHEIVRTLNTTFVTPLDREDIHALAHGLDDVMDAVEAAADSCVLHKIDTPTEAMKVQAALLLRACEAVAEGVTRLRGFKDLDQHWLAVKDIESDGDRVYRSAVASLFNNGHNAMDVMRVKEVHEQLETAIDGCEDIANTLEAIVLKNA